MSKPTARENYYPLLLPTELYLALIKRLAETGLSKGDCLIDLLAESLFREGYLPEEHYRFLKEKYGTKTVLEKVLEGRKERAEAIGREQPDQKVLQLQKTLVMITKQWEEVPEKSKQYYVEKAKEFKDSIPEAREILRKAGILNE